MNSGLYSKETYFKLEKSYKMWLIISLAIFTFGLAFLFLSGLLINEQTVLAVKIVDLVVVNISFLVAAYFFIEFFVKRRIRSKFVYRLLTVDRYSGAITIQEIKKPYFVRKWIKAYEINALDDSGKKIVCYYEDIEPLPFKVGDTLNMTLASNFIVDIEGSENEKSN